MRIKTSEATPRQLNWLVAKLEGEVQDIDDFALSIKGEYDYVADWAKGGPIIDRKGISLKKNQASLYPTKHLWVGISEDLKMEAGPAPLIAAMRCLVASELGDEVDVPEELA